MPYASRDKQLAYWRQYRSLNRARKIEQDRVYRTTIQTPEHRREYRQKYRIARADKVTRDKREYYLKHKDRINETARLRRQANPLYERTKMLRQKYGMTPQAFEALLHQQQNKCAICATPFEEARPGVDHDHATGAVRGILCDRCNMGIGQFRDDPALARAAAEYLERRRGVS